MPASHERYLVRSRAGSALLAWCAAAPGTVDIVIHEFATASSAVDNFRRVETNRMLFGMVLNAGGINHFRHETEPIALDLTR